ncbi:hypothetical protein [Desulforhopalus sp. 52FAK]
MANTNKNQGRWFFPTNKGNLGAALLCGLLRDKKGYGEEKYYSDVTENFESGIPIYRGTSQELKKVLHSKHPDQTNLSRCLLEIDLPLLKNISLDENVVLLPAPLPISSVKKIVFENKEIGDQIFKIISGTDDNIPLAELSFGSEKDLFVRENSLLLNEEGDGKQIRAEIYKPHGQVCKPVDYDKVFAYGGVLCMLFYFAKNGEVANSMLNAFGKKTDNVSSVKEYHDIFKVVEDFFYTKGHPESFSPASRVIREVVTILCSEKDFGVQLGLILDTLKSEKLLGVFEDKYKGRISEIANKLNDFYKKKLDETASQTFAGEEKSALARQLLYLFFKDMPEKVIDEKFSAIDMKQEEIVLVGMLAGIRFGFNGMPASLRKYSGLYRYVSHKMASYAHEMVESDLKLGNFTPPKTVFDIVLRKGVAKGKKLDFLSWFSKKYGLDSCFETKLSGSQIKQFIGKIMEIAGCMAREALGKIFPSDVTVPSETPVRPKDITLEGVIVPDWCVEDKKYFGKMRDVAITNGDYEEILRKCK